MDAKRTSEQIRNMLMSDNLPLNLIQQLPHFRVEDVPSSLESLSRWAGALYEIEQRAVCQL